MFATNYIGAALTFNETILYLELILWICKSHSKLIPTFYCIYYTTRHNVEVIKLSVSAKQQIYSCLRFENSSYHKSLGVFSCGSNLSSLSRDCSDNTMKYTGDALHHLWPSLLYWWCTASSVTITIILVMHCSICDQHYYTGDALHHLWPSLLYWWCTGASVTSTIIRVMHCIICDTHDFTGDALH